MKIITGGISRRNGFILWTDKYRFESRLAREGIEVSHESITNSSKKKSKTEAWILKSPLGQYLDPALGLLSWKFILGLAFFQYFFYHFCQSLPYFFRQEFSTQSEVVVATIVIIILILFMSATLLLLLIFLIRFFLFISQLLRFHSVEHMCTYAVENGIETDIEYFRSCPRVALNCGSVLSLLMAILVLPTIYIVPTQYLPISLWVSCIFILVLRQILIIHGPKKVIGMILFLQKAVCWKPTEKQLLLGVETLKYIRKFYPSITEA